MAETPLVPGRMNTDLVYVIEGDWQHLLYCDGWGVTGVSAGDIHWFGEGPHPDEIRVGGSTGYVSIDDDGVEGDTIRSVTASPLVVEEGPGVERWVLAPRVLPPGRWLIQTEFGATHRFAPFRENRPNPLRFPGLLDYWIEDLTLSANPQRPALRARLIEPLVTGLPAHLELVAGPQSPVETSPITAIRRLATPEAVPRRRSTE